MTIVGRTRGAALCAASLASAALVGCGGGGDFKDKPRPAVPLHLTGVINNRTVTVEPSNLGAGPIDLVIANLSKEAHTVTIEGGPQNTTEQVGPINPQDTGHIQETLRPGTYTVKAGSEQAAARLIKPATLQVGPHRASSSNTLLLP